MEIFSLNEIAKIQKMAWLLKAFQNPCVRSTPTRRKNQFPAKIKIKQSSIEIRK
jgi:hypothetical protein